MYKSIKFFIILFFVINLNIYSAEWKQQFPIPPANTLVDIFMLDENIGWAGGVNGTLLKTIDGGVTWEIQNSGTVNLINKIFFLDENLGWFISGNLHLFKTTNGGKDWKKSNIEVVGFITSIYFTNNDVGYIVGYSAQQIRIYKSTDTGNSWMLIDLQHGLLGRLNCVHFINENIGWAGGSGLTQEGSIYYTTNGGDKWEEFSQKIFKNKVTDVKLFDVNFGIAIGENGFLICTSDGGKTWEDKSLQFTFSNFISISKIGEESAYVIGVNGAFGNRQIVFRTTDKGVNWERLNDSPVYDPNFTWQNGTFVSATTGLIVCSHGFILKTEDAANSFVPISEPLTNSIYSIDFVDDLNGWAVGSNGLLLNTTNGGSDWIIQDIGISNFIFSVKFIDEFNGWCNVDYQYLIQTTDGGQTWIEHHLDFDGSINFLNIVNNNVGYALLTESGENLRSLYKTTNAGVDWEVLQLDAEFNISDMVFVDEEHGWISSKDKRILRTTNGGLDWELLNAQFDIEITNLFFLNKDIGFYTNTTGLLGTTTDGGLSWGFEFIEMEYSPRQIFFLDQQNGWVVGASGSIYYTSNGGQDWTKQVSKTTNLLYDVYFRAVNLGWTTGVNGTILSYSDKSTDVKVEQNLIQKENTLFKIFPNPTYDKLNIISENDEKLINSTLSIYDLLGNSIYKKKLNNPQNYEQLDINSLTSGIYFITIERNNKILYNSQFVKK